MWYLFTSLAILVCLLIAGRLARRTLSPDHPGALAAIPVPVPVAPPAEPLRAAPGAPNTDPPTDRHVTARGTASIHRRTGRRTSTGA